jgi:2-keto-4-pentenoate hydratase
MSDLANALYRTRTGGGLVDMSEYTSPLNEDEAYALQSEVAALFQSGTVGWKLGATNANTLQLLGFAEPFISPLLATHCFGNNAEVPVFMDHSPALETEFLVKLAADLPARDEPYTHDEVAAAIEYVCPAFEIVACRVVGGLNTAGLMLIADGAVNQSVVHGEVVENWQHADLSDHSLRVDIDGVEVATGSSNLLLWGSPLGAVAWLAAHRQLGTRGLRSGDLIITGTCGGLIPLHPGARAEADFGSLGSVALSVRAA